MVLYSIVVRDDKDNKKDTQMARTITITKGNQYDREGYYMTDGMLGSHGHADPADPNGYTLDGNLWPWSRSFAGHKDAIHEAIRATLADGIKRTITIGTAKSERVITSPADANICPKCDTYCMGDCDS